MSNPFNKEAHQDRWYIWAKFGGERDLYFWCEGKGWMQFLPHITFYPNKLLALSDAHRCCARGDNDMYRCTAIGVERVY